MADEQHGRRRRLHFGIAEQGKVHALDGKHELALTHYREAMRIAVENREPEIVCRHYLECMLESFEHLRWFDELLECCDRAIATYADRPPSTPLSRLDLASLHQRRGAVLLKKGDGAAAKEALEQARELARRESGRLPLAEALLGWIARGYRVEPGRITAEQKRWDYYGVRPGQVVPERAIPLPEELRRDSAV